MTSPHPAPSSSHAPVFPAVLWLSYPQDGYWSSVTVYNCTVVEDSQAGTSIAWLGLDFNTNTHTHYVVKNITLLTIKTM